jgi:septal ring factor EnvC (AmiA/AmiB activator)
MTMHAQSKETLEKERTKLLRDIKFTNKLLSETKTNQGTALEELQAIKQQITLRKRLIRTIDREAVALQKKMNRNKEQIEMLESDLVDLKEQYAELMYISYKNKSADDKLLYIFASDNLYQAWMRMSHLKELAKYQERQGELIVESKAEIVAKNAELKEQKKEKLVLIDEQKKAKSQMDKDKARAQSLLDDLKSQEQDLKKKLQDQEKKKKELDKQIRKALEAEANKVPGGFKLSPEEKLVSSTFVKNKGGLPWPVDKGVIIGRFGVHPHPVLPGVEITNNGIDIATEKGATCRAIFEGEVTGVMDIPGAGMAVIIKHGGYRTVYANLKEVLVEKGQIVDTKQTVGVLLDEDNRSVAHLEIWQITSAGMKKSDPQKWIAR